MGLESRDVLEQAQELGLDVKTASSGLDDEGAELVRMAFSSDEPAAVEQSDGEVEETQLEGTEAEETEADTEAQADEPATEPEEVAPADADESAEADEPTETKEPAQAKDVEITSVPAGASVADFAAAISQPTGEVVKALMGKGVPAGANAEMPSDLIEEIGESFGYIVEIEEAAPPPVVAEQPEFDDDEADLVGRPPVVTVMGHVDHGKTTLLDTIRSANVVEGEEGGITQHIGAYQVEVNGHPITFIDTPGHEAFTALRARGANITDIVILVVAADDGVMPQTIEAISHAQAAGVKMIVAVNKIDLPGADPLRVRTELTEQGVIVEELGGDVPSVEVSAVNGDGVSDLLEVIDLISQLEEFKANPKPKASGVVVEAQLERGRGAVATAIVQRGTLKQGDAFVAGAVSGRARALLNDRGEQLKKAGPATPVQIMGWDEMPAAGDFLEVVKNDREARKIAAARLEEVKAEEQAMPSARDRLQGLLEQLRSEDAQLNVVVKADAQGSLEALRESIGKIEREGGQIEIVHGAVGGINENDVSLADVTGAVIVGFNVRPEPKSRKAAEQAGIEIRTYGVIYELLDDIEQLLVGQLAPDEQEQVLGTAEVRATFKVPRGGTVAGCYVLEGTVQRGAKARLLRDGVIVHDGVVSSLRRFKDDVREVAQGFECGMGFENYNDIKEGDLIEVYLIREVART
ncbi:MAG: translation initiation factor IF-2 [Actinobacteria bacterium]|nr:MAG: translation initiation factor IF-2 [Actinomycetota bacterium]REK40396.1 MAG: translation initiation factor IF-2 [Actinomycetota bacterium]